MIPRPPRSTQSRSSAASDVYKRQYSGKDYPRFPLFLSNFTQRNVNHHFNYAEMLHHMIRAKSCKEHSSLISYHPSITNEKLLAKMAKVCPQFTETRGFEDEGHA
eukprot:TRINITY_DN13472_c0_g1_i1.p1 TRINITY_DN13472_c0_g1~~TRINITY_DN13472_c0_g1_i1.p1  ORF type:complete len:105 (+),score=39.03 TRINITY_DN13472_c0_g1_i1:3-317(+)